MDYNKKIKTKDQIIWALALIIFLVSGIISYTRNGREIWEKILNQFNLSEISEKESNYNMSVNFIDVGKADCSYIRCRDANILIDSGDRDVSKNICEYLKKRDVKRLDLVIASHPHRDHIGQMCSIIENFEISCFIMSEIPDNLVPTSFTYHKMIEALNKRKVNIRIAVPGEIISVGDLKIQILGPWRKHENINDNSVIAKITYGSDDFLFTGDAEKAAENDLVGSGLNLHSEVLKVGHHGSKTSSTEKFIKCVDPRYAVISTRLEKNKSLSKEIIDRFERFKVKILRTDFNGDVIFLTNGYGLKTVTEKTAA